MEIDRLVERAIEGSTNRHELWSKILYGLRCVTVCEVGVWKGEFAKVLLEQVPSIHSYTLIDPWRNLPDWNKPANKSNVEFENIRREALERLDNFKHKIVERRGTTKNAAPSLQDASLDFAYIDGDHTLRGITIDLISILPKIKKGGFIGGDDFTKSIWQHGLSFSPTEVFPFAVYFAEAYELCIYTLPYNQFMIRNVPHGFVVKDYGGYSHLSPVDIYRQQSSAK